MGNKTESITVRVTKTQKEKIQSLANDMGLTNSEYMLKCILKETSLREVPCIIRDIDKLIHKYEKGEKIDLEDMKNLRKEAIRIWI